MPNEVIFIILDTIFTVSCTIRINGQEKHREVVKSILLKLDSLDITEVLDKYKSLAYRISNAQGYLLSMLYNHKLENNTKIQNQVICDMYAYL